VFASLLCQFIKKTDRSIDSKLDIKLKHGWCNTDWQSFSVYCDFFTADNFYNRCGNSNDFWHAFSECLNIGIARFVPLIEYRSNRIGNTKLHRHIISNLLVKKSKLWSKTTLYFETKAMAARVKYKQCLSLIKSTRSLLAIKY